MVRFGNAEFLEENGRHVFIVMLAGVEKDLLHPGHGPEHPGDGCCLDELGPGPDHCEDFHNI
jgi:hypothetical protein